VKGPTGAGLTRQQIIATFARRLRNQPEDELREALRQIGRIAEMRINDLLGYRPVMGATVMQWAEESAPCRKTKAPSPALSHRDAPTHSRADCAVDARGRHACAYRCGGQRGGAISFH
jgi:hypothetical protein